MDLRNAAIGILIGLTIFVAGFGGFVVLYPKFTENNHITATTTENSAKIKNLKNVSEEREEVKLNNVATRETNNEKIYSLFLTEADFRERFNSTAAKDLSDINLYLSKEYVYNGDYANVYQNVFDSANSLVVSYEPDSERLRGVLLTGTGTSQNETVTFLGVIAGIVASLNSELSPAERKTLLQELGMFNPNGTDYKHINKSAYRNNVHYKIQGTNGNGVLFFATAKDMETHGGSSVKRNSPHNIVADVTNYIVWDAQNQQASTKYEASAPPVASETVSDENMNYYARYSAETTLISFHGNITAKNYRDAYNHMTPNLQQKIPYDGWVQGFKTTVVSSVSDFDLVSQTSDKIVLKYRLKAEDNPGGIQYFNGTAVLVKSGYDWKIDDVTNKKI